MEIDKKINEQIDKYNAAKTKFEESVTKKRDDLRVKKEQ